MDLKDIKNKILEKLIAEMDNREGDRLKSMSPKSHKGLDEDSGMEMPTKVSVIAKDEEGLEEGLDKAKEMVSSDKPVEDIEEAAPEAPEEDEEDMKRLMELYKGLK